MEFTETEKRFMREAKERIESLGSVGVESDADGNTEIAPGVWVTQQRLDELMENAL